MKISKLFHWLYAILMLLPILVFIPNAFYYGFNETAVAQEKTEQVPIYYETNTVNSYSDLVNGHAYLLEVPAEQFNSFVLYVYDFEIIETDSITYYTRSTTRPTPFIGNNSNANGISVFATPNGNNNSFNFTGSIAFIYNYRDTAFNNSRLLDLIFPYYNYVKDYSVTITNMSITDSMSYAWESVWHNDLFSWSYGSFLTQPFIYIGNLFNVPVDNTLYYALSYWLDISLIWLTFDLLMYVPLLVHRWLDKGIIE